MSIKEEDKIDLDKLVKEFVQLINEDSQDLSTDPNVKRVKVIKADCGCCSKDCSGNENN